MLGVCFRFGKPIHIIFNNSLFAYYIITMFSQPSFVQKYVYNKKTNYDMTGENNEKMVGGMPINQSSYNSTALNNNISINRANLVGLDKYALPAGLVLSTTLFSEQQSGGGKRHYSDSSEFDRKMITGAGIIGDEMFDKLFGMAAHSMVQPRNNITHKIVIRGQSKSYTKSNK